MSNVKLPVVLPPSRVTFAPDDFLESFVIQAIRPISAKEISAFSALLLLLDVGVGTIPAEAGATLETVRLAATTAAVNNFGRLM